MRYLLAFALLASAAFAQSPAAARQSAPAQDVPAYHATPAKASALPPTLPPTTFADPRVQAAYRMAATIRGVLYQMPCYCHCDKEIGHKSLLDCFAGDHASICDTCMMEGVYAYRQTKAGKSPAQIRASIESGAWRNVNLNDLISAPKVY